jgi:hypothetical protein
MSRLLFAGDARISLGWSYEEECSVFIWQAAGNDSRFSHMSHGLTVRIDCESGSLRASICSRKIPGTILVQMSSDHESRYPDVPKSAALLC